MQQKKPFFSEKLFRCNPKRVSSFAFFSFKKRRLRKVSDSVEGSDAEAKNALDVVKRNATDGSKPAVVHLLAVISEHEDTARRHLGRRKIADIIDRIAALIQRNTVDEDVSRDDLHGFTGHTDNSLDEKTVFCGKQYDIPALRHTHKLADPVAKHHFSAIELRRHALIDNPKRRKPNKKHKAKNGYRDQHGEEPSQSSCVSIGARAAIAAPALSQFTHEYVTREMVSNSLNG